MFEFIKRLFKDDSGATAKDRLKVIIFQDRNSINQETMDNLKKDILNLFKKYLDIDEEGLEVNLAKEKRGVGLSINVPIKKVKGKEE